MLQCFAETVSTTPELPDHSTFFSPLLGLPSSTVVGVTPLRSPENGSPDFSYFIHAQVTWSYHPPTSWNA
jgi:hypothetical protein